MTNLSTNPANIINYNKSRILATPGNVMRFPSEDIPYKMLLNFTEYSFSTSSPLTSSNDQTANMIRNPAGSVVLPLPLQLVDSTNIDATSVSARTAAILDRTGEVLSGENAGLGLDDLALYADLVSKGLMAAGTAVASKSKLVGGLLLGAGGAIQAGTGDTAQQLFGIAMNPFETMQFKGVRLKQHSFSWRLSPSTIGESNTLQRIINRIKANILPEYINPDVKSAHALLKYPAIATISFYGIDQNYYYKLKPSMITSFTVNYNGGEQLSVYRGGKPAVVDIRMDLTEMTIHTSSDYGGATYSELPKNTPGVYSGVVLGDAAGSGNEWVNEP